MMGVRFRPGCCINGVERCNALCTQMTGDHIQNQTEGALRTLLDMLAEAVYFTQRKGGKPDAASYVEKIRGLMQP